ncbi:MAG: hypothetical protein AVDCRST_MAG08-1597, partial [uncultured Acetobacteraceae bacterium]
EPRRAGRRCGRGRRPGGRRRAERDHALVGTEQRKAVRPLAGGTAGRTRAGHAAPASARRVVRRGRTGDRPRRPPAALGGVGIRPGGHPARARDDGPEGRAVARSRLLPDRLRPARAGARVDAGALAGPAGEGRPEHLDARGLRRGDRVRRRPDRTAPL